MSRPAETFETLWSRRELALSWLTVLCAALFFTLAAWLPLSLDAQVGAVVWSISVGAPAGGLALSALVWALVSLWIVRGARAEGEPPLAGAPLLIFAVGGMLIANAVSAWDLMWIGARLETWPVLAGWALGAVILIPWGSLVTALSTDPGRRIERLWWLHRGAGVLLLVGASGPLIALIALLNQPGVTFDGADPVVVALTLGMLVLIGLLLSILSFLTRAVGAGLDEARLLILDLPPQPARSRYPQWAALAEIMMLALSTIGVTPWPEARAVQAHLAEVGLAPPTDGRAQWLTLKDVDRRRLVTGKGFVRPVFSSSGDQVAATLHGENPGFWILDRRVSWLPQQQRDLWDISELTLSPSGDRLLVGRRSGLLQIRAFPKDLGDPSWTEHRWDKIFSIGERVQLTAETAVALGEQGQIRRWDASRGEWRDHLHLARPLQSIVLSPDHRLLAGFWGSEQIGVWDEMGNLIFHTERRGVRKLIWAPDGAALYAVGQGVAEIPLDPSQKVRVIDPRPVTNAALSADGRWMALGGHGVRVVSVQDGAELLREREPSSGGVTGLSWHPEGRGLAVGTSSGILELWWFTHREWAN